MQLMRQFAALALRPRWWRRVMQFYLPLAVVCLVMTVALYRIERSAAIAQQQRQAGDVMRGIERELDEMINDAATDLVRLASDHDLMQTLLAGSNSNAIRDDFLALLRIKPVYTDLSLVDAQGREQLKVRLRHSVAAVAEPALHERYAGRPLF
uniref:hypothetical protein n=1 Tax=Chitinimonas sp. TaxID=1934313 RepID=UPI0035B0FC52